MKCPVVHRMVGMQPTSPNPISLLAPALTLGIPKLPVTLPFVRRAGLVLERLDSDMWGVPLTTFII